MDIIEIYRIAEAISKRGGRFLKKIFTEEEVQYCSKKRDPASCYAARFAAKEAFFKALSPPSGMTIPFSSIEIANNQNGKPKITILDDKIQEHLQSIGAKSVSLSITHSRLTAAAVVVIE